MKFVNSIPQSFFTGAGLLRTPNMRGGAAPRPLHSSLDAGAPPCTRVTFPSRGKSPKARQGLRPWTCRCRVTALFALAALRSGSRRAGFCHRKRPICHFEFVGKPVFVVSFGFDQEKYSAVNPWRGRGMVARLDATFGGIRGIGGGGLAGVQMERRCNQGCNEVV